MLLVHFIPLWSIGLINEVAKLLTPPPLHVFIFQVVFSHLFNYKRKSQQFYIYSLISWTCICYVFWFRLPTIILHWVAAPLFFNLEKSRRYSGSSNIFCVPLSSVFIVVYNLTLWYNSWPILCIPWWCHNVLSTDLQRNYSSLQQLPPLTFFALFFAVSLDTWWLQIWKSL